MVEAFLPKYMRGNYNQLWCTSIKQGCRKRITQQIPDSKAESIPSSQAGGKIISFQDLGCLHHDSRRSAEFSQRGRSDGLRDAKRQKESRVSFCCDPASRFLRFSLKEVNG